MSRQTSSILDRNRYQVYSVPVQRVSEVEGVSSDLRWSKELTPKELIRFLFWLHDRRNLRPQRTMVSLMREAKAMVGEFSQEELSAAMIKAANATQHPWGFGFVRKFLEEGHNADRDSVESKDAGLWA